MDAERAGNVAQDTATALREAGLRATRPRALILELFREMRGHHSADGLVAQLNERGHRLPRASVYGVVEALTRGGLLSIAHAGSGRTLYELTTVPHSHFLCVTCGELTDVVCTSSSIPCADDTSVPGRVLEAQVIFRGICRDCDET